MFYLLLIFATASGAWAAHLALIQAPADAMQGNVQRIFYFHVPLVWVSFLAFVGGAVMSLRYLKSREMRHDDWARAFIKTGWAFTTTVLVTGPLWGKPVWGVYWNWGDERLVSFFVMWMMYNGYLLLRSTIADFETGARIGAVLALLAVINAALVVAAIYIWKTAQHPSPVFIQKGGSGLKDPAMSRAFWASFSAFTLLFISILVARLKVERSISGSHGFHD
ncbi:MAG: cytochrome c biogenesis protein CcsA [Spirochaetes bacterium]|nr:cytochrome c biogenesis protein CcsA [Spirochaetota bacterium]